MKISHVKSSDLNNLQPSIKEELAGISGLLIQVFRKFGTDTKFQRTGRNLTCNDTLKKIHRSKFLYHLLISNPLQ